MNNGVKLLDAKIQIRQMDKICMMAVTKIDLKSHIQGYFGENHICVENRTVFLKKW